MNRTFRPNRQGITLLFVISMIVLFLLMGTAFVIVSNNFNRASVERIRSNLAEGRGQQQSTQLLEDVIVQIIHGPALDDVDSPLRGNDFLSDQYGYGVKSFVAGSGSVAPRLVGGQAFLEISLTSNPLSPSGDPSTSTADGSGFNLLLPGSAASVLDSTSLGNTHGGRVLSFTSGPAKGFSTRIYSDYFDTNGVHVFRIPTTSVGGDIITQNIISNSEFAGSEIIINGHDFGGTGASVQVDASGNPTNLGTQSLLPNRVGQPYNEMVGLPNATTNSAYLSITDSSGMASPWNASVNEPWDAPDVSTMFLAGFDKFGNPIASFHRQALMDFATANGLSSTPRSGRTFFHAFDVDGDNLPDVDTNGDLIADSFWMDLGSSITTNRNGKRFKPLVAIHIRDLDGLLNVNAHGNRTHLDADGYVNNGFGKTGSSQTWINNGPAPTSPLGLGMGTPEINITAAVGGEAELEDLLNARYSGDSTTVSDQVPGNGLTSLRSRAKLFGYPNDAIRPDTQFGTIGGFFGTAMDIHGRFHYGYPSSSDSGFIAFADPNFPNFNNSLPQINVLTTNAFAKPGPPTNKLTDEFAGNPYGLSLSGKSTGDNPFTTDELEGVLRPDDVDSRVLPTRLTNLLLNSPNPNIFTTDSFETPMLYRDFTEVLIRRIQQRNTSIAGNDAAVTNLISLLKSPNQFAFSPELFRGLKMDINRPFGDGIDNNGNGQFDEPGEELVADNADALNLFRDGDGKETKMDLNFDGQINAGDASATANPRVLYARHLYMLAMLLMEPADLNKDGVLTGTSDATIAEADPERLAFAQAIAQWAVNVVDFRDPDSIYTQFVYDPFPWDAATGWNPPLDGDGNPMFVAWGCERPELLLTETLAVHIQNMEKKSSGPTYEQRLRPEPFAYFEVYNPWTQNLLNQRFDPSLSNARQSVSLRRKAPDGSPIWRFEVERAQSEGNGTITYTPLRYIYMTSPGTAITYTDPKKNQVADNIEIFYSNVDRLGGTVRAGQQAIIGTRGFEDPDNRNTFQVFMGRKNSADDASGSSADNLMLDETTRIALSDRSIRRFTGNTEDPSGSRTTSVVFIDQAFTVSDRAGTLRERKFSLSDPYDGYSETDLTEIDKGDGSFYAVPFPTSLDDPNTGADKNRTQDELSLMIRVKDGISKNFRFVRLQRLANPLIAWNAITNPYLTIDSMEVDLVSINGADVQDPSITQEPTNDFAVSHERGDASRTLWGLQRENAIRSPMPAASLADADHYFTAAFDESLGKTNDVFEPGNAGNTTPFPWLTWNNRPFVSHMEIINVPYLAPDRLTYAPEASADSSLFPTQPFTVGNAPLTPGGASSDLDPFTETRAGALAGRYGHLLNFFASEDSTTNMFADAYQLLNFIEVPSRFVGNESYYLTDTATSPTGTPPILKHPFNTISRYRVPGKVNINTIPSADVWNAIVGQYSNSVSWNTLKNSLYGAYDQATGPSGPTNFENPFRPAEAANLLPGQSGAIQPSACTLMRPATMGASPQVPLFDYSTGTAVDNPQRSAAFRNGIRTRLGNMVTNRSSVFACWITVGYFEVDENDQLIDNTSGAPISSDPTVPATPAAGTVAEIGADTGEQVRNRAFFIFDRSIPVAFEPGKNHNVEDAILIKSIIE